MNVTRVIVSAGTVLALAACGGSAPAAPAQVHVHGSFGWSVASTCQMSELEGAQVQITDASGKVLATATLPVQGKQGTLDGIPVFQFPYSATVPAEARYGVSVSGITPYYLSQAQFVKGVDLSC